MPFIYRKELKMKSIAQRRYVRLTPFVLVAAPIAAAMGAGRWG
jgi:hypothetical protein